MESDDQTTEPHVICEANLTRKISPLTIEFHVADRAEPIGLLDFSGPEMTFKGCADSSAKIFFDSLLGNFRAAWRQEFEETRRQLERELAAAIKHRDEARREICERENTIRCEHGYDQFDEQSIAAERGWDCFKEGGGA